jgi:hypothetical protein
MTPGAQPVLHPDENLLAAFAEHSLAAPERAGVMEHLSTCARCRDIVFLTRQATEADANAVAASQAQRSRNWNWGWLMAAGALATALVFGSISLLRHSEKLAAPLQSAAVPPPASAPEAGIAPPTAQEIAPAPDSIPEKHVPRPTAPPLAKHHPTVEVIEPPEVAMAGAAPLPPPRAGSFATAAPPKNSMTKNNEAARGKVGAAGFANGVVGGVAAGSGGGIGSGVAGRVPSSAVTGHASIATGGFGSAAGAAPPGNAAPNSQSTKLDFKLQVGKSTTVVDVAAAEPLLHTEAADLSTTFPMEQLQGMPATLSLQHGEVVRCVAAACSSVKPSSKRVVSLASDARIALAVDAGGALFLSHDQGRHWAKTPVQWNGKAVAISISSSVENGNNRKPILAKMAPPAGNFDRNPVVDKSLRAAATPSVFELRNKKGQVWLSTDEGQTWRLKSQ